MLDKVNMSLDEIIKSTKRPVATGSNRGGRRVMGNNNIIRPRRNVRLNVNSVPVFNRSRQLTNRMINRNISKGNLNESWPHDLFLENNYDQPPRKAYTTTPEMATLLISNLDFGVTDSDIVELFSEIGPIKKATIHYDRSGQSLGTAEVIYERQFDAAKAQRQYHGVPLDGRPMNIQSVTSEMLDPLPKRRTFNNFVSKEDDNANEYDIISPRRPRINRINKMRVVSGVGNGGGSIGVMGNRMRKNNQVKRDLITVEELDAELDSYAMEIN